MPLRQIDKVRRFNRILAIAMENDAFSLFLRFLTASREHGFVITDITVPEGMPLKFRKLLEQLGPSFIKIGQFLSTRPDLMPPGFVDELQNLYDSTPPSPFPDIKKVVEEELGAPLCDIFATFDEKPVASASIAQVHLATLKNGARVAVKVQHPGIEQDMMIDFEILRTLAKFVEREFADARVWQPARHLEEFRRMVVRELDFAVEAKNQAQVHENFSGSPEIVIPRIYQKYSCKRVLTMEFMDGVKPLSAGDLGAKGINGREVARFLTNSMAKQIFIDRLFHGDPSPGNLLVQEGGKIVFLDFGAVGVLTRRRKDLLVRMVMAFVTSNAEELARVFILLCDKEGDVDEQAFSRDVEKVIDYFERERPSIGDPGILNMVIEASNKHRMLLPADFMLLMKAWYQFEGLCKRLDPGYDVAVVIEPYLRETVMAKFAQEKQEELSKTLIMEYLKFLEKLPKRLNVILRKLENNDMQLKVTVMGQREQDARRQRTAVFASFSVIIAALIIGLAIVVSAGDSRLAAMFCLLSLIAVLAWALLGMAFLRK